jgi:hypothetical protein
MREWLSRHEDQRHHVLVATNTTSSRNGKTNRAAERAVATAAKTTTSAAATPAGDPGLSSPVVVGWASIPAYRAMSCYDGRGGVRVLCLHSREGCHRQGIGRALLLGLVDEARRASTRSSSRASLIPSTRRCPSLRERGLQRGRHLREAREAGRGDDGSTRSSSRSLSTRTSCDWRVSLACASLLHSSSMHTTEREHDGCEHPASSFVCPSTSHPPRESLTESRCISRSACTGPLNCRSLHA